MISRLLAPSVLLVSCVPFIFSADPPTPATPFAPKLVTLDLNDTPLDKALDELEKQVPIPFERERLAADRRVTLSVKKVPFWEALEKLAKAADHRIYFLEAGRKILLVGNERITYRETPLSIDGPFRLGAKRVTSVYDLESEQSLYEVHLDLHWEPTVSVFLVEPPGKNVKAKDNTDKDLTIHAAGSRLPASGGGINLQMRLGDIPRSTRTIKSIQGEFTIVGSTGMMKFDFDKWAEKEQSQTQDGVTVKVRNDFKKDSDLWTARVMIEYPETGPQLESFESSAWLANNEAYLVSPDGKKKFEANGGWEVISQSERRAEMNYRWVPQANAPKLGDPAEWKLVVVTPSKLVEAPVKFKLENIPLP
jgi:hypothetical protein